ERVCRSSSRSIAFTDRIKSSLESISVPSKSKINARTAGKRGVAISSYSNSLGVFFNRLQSTCDVRLLRFAADSRRLYGFGRSENVSGEPMAQVFPFRAYRYNPAKAQFGRVLTQPYDKISSAMQEQYYGADPHNLITIEKGKSYQSDSVENNVYTRAARAVHDWISKQV